MNILFQSRQNLFTVPGGDTIQIVSTKEELEKLGVNVKIELSLEPDLNDVDIVHIFNLNELDSTYIQVMNAKKQNKFVAVSTIYGLYTDYEKKARLGKSRYILQLLSSNQIKYLKTIIKAFKHKNFNRGVKKLFWKGYRKALKETVSNIDLFLPNSEMEMNQIVKDFNLKKYNYSVIPNSINSKIFDYEKTDIVPELEKYHACILCVARIEGRKNQLNLVKAMKGLPYKLLLIGQSAPNHQGYFNLVKEFANDNVIFLDQIDHQNLAQYYKLAKVHVLASWWETTGLSSLEAIAMKCNIVVTKKGFTEEYFGENGFYCDPDNVESIKKAIVKAFKSPINEKFRLKILKENNWCQTAIKTLSVYKKNI